MTIKQITELTGRSYKTICNWCNLVNYSNISVKITEAKESSKPAEFTLEETIEILRAGKVSDMMISLLEENARQSSSIVDGKLINKLLEQITELVNINKKLISGIDAKKPDEPLKLAYSNKNDIWITTSELCYLIGCCRATAITTAFKKGWERRPSPERKHLTYEYNLNSLPDNLQGRFFALKEMGEL